MKTAGIIAEFNPFHDGHKYLIEECRRTTGADRVVVIMSGDFTQRGLPAITEKRVRTHMALINGADAVLNYPVRFATSSAESFASHAVNILEGIGCIDTLVFGSESGDIEELKEAASFFLEEPDEYKEKLREYLKEGFSFPEARARAAEKYADLLDLPNNILGVEYIKALISSGSDIEPVTIKRPEDTGVISDSDKDRYSQGYTVRKRLLEMTSMPGLKVDIPENALDVLKDDLTKYGMTSRQDFSILLADRLWTFLYPEMLSAFEDISDDLARTIVKKRNTFESFYEFSKMIQTKNYTLTRVNRALLHLLLRIRKREISPECYYAHILGFNREKEDTVSLICNSSKIPVITGYKDVRSILPKDALDILGEEVQASNIYETVRSQKARQPFKNEMSRPVLAV